MRIVRFSKQGKVKYGVLEGNTVHGLRGSPFTRFKATSHLFSFDGSDYEIEEIKLLAPCAPSKIVGLGLNYRSHAEETKLPIPTTPLIFLKPSTAVTGPGDKIILPRFSKRVDYEGELGVVIGKRATRVSRNEAKDYVLGYTCVNDVSERYIQKEDGQWARAKGFNTFAPIGPWIDDEVAPEALRLETYLNDELRQSANTSDLIFGVSELISFVSNIMTLLPGDIIATGTPSGIGRMSPGDIVEVKIEQIGTLKNFVVEQK